MKMDLKNNLNVDTQQFIKHAAPLLQLLLDRFPMQSKFSTDSLFPSSPKSEAMECLMSGVVGVMHDLGMLKIARSPLTQELTISISLETLRETLDGTSFESLFKKRLASGSTLLPTDI